MKDFRELKVWEKAHQLSLAVYKNTANFPKDEFYGLTSQIRRACTSIPMNIAEGCGRGSDADFAHFLQIAMGSACETEYQLLLSRDLGYLSQDNYSALQDCIQEVKRMISSLLKTLRTTSHRLTADS
jgi:four helix bundle protein